MISPSLLAMFIAAAPANSPPATAVTADVEYVLRVEAATASASDSVEVDVTIIVSGEHPDTTVSRQKTPFESGFKARKIIAVVRSKAGDVRVTLSIPGDTKLKQPVASAVGASIVIGEGVLPIAPRFVNAF